MRAVASDESGRRTVFVEEAADRTSPSGTATRKPRAFPASTTSPQRAPCSLREASPGPAPESTASPSQTGACCPIRSRASDRQAFFSPLGLEQTIASGNAGYLERLVEQLRSPLGAGMCAEFGLPLWDAFLRDAAAETGLGPTVEQMLRESDYEGAAELLERNVGSSSRTGV